MTTIAPLHTLINVSQLQDIRVNFYSPNQDLLEIIPHVVNLQTSNSLIPSILGERSNTVIWHSYYVGLVRVLQVVGIFVCHIEENLLTAIAAMITVIVQIV